MDENRSVQPTVETPQTQTPQPQYQDSRTQYPDTQTQPQYGYQAPQPQPQYGYQAPQQTQPTPQPQPTQQTQPTPQPRPQQPPVQYQPVSPDRHGKGGGWISFMRVLAWVMFTVLELAVLISGVVLIIHGFNSYYASDEQIVAGIITIIVGTFMAFVMAAGMMIVLDLAKNVSRIASNTADTNAKLDAISRKLEK